MAEITEKDIVEIKETLKNMQDDIQVLLTNQAVREEAFRKIEDHRQILYGRDGLINKVDYHDKWISNANKVAWAIILVFIGTISTGIITLLKVMPYLEILVK